MNIQKIYELFLLNNSVSIDTRNIKSNDIFFAINGPNFNGNKFALEAIKKNEETDYHRARIYFTIGWAHIYFISSRHIKNVQLV